ncbi:hypothetical protein [Novosphingobium sp.]|uniref:hypothetical protein n=1 Tax=Novosphingobium sp. TaxID=1874826 RepID=UPI0035B11604
MVHENAVNWSQGFWGSEHPDTAALRVKKEYVDKMIALKRENMDRVYAYLTGLIEKAKEELQHARGSNADHRRFALRQQIDEIVAYLKGQALDVPAPSKYGPEAGSGYAGTYNLDEISDFFGRVKCVADQWFDSHLIAVYDEMVTLINLQK